jgi:hypothetical protein
LYARNAGKPVTGKGNGSHVVNTMKNGFAIIKTFNYASSLNVSGNVDSLRLNARFKDVAAYPELAITQLGIADFFCSSYSRLLFISGFLSYCFLVANSFFGGASLLA